jgi:hypothetical protein
VRSSVLWVLTFHRYQKPDLTWEPSQYYRWDDMKGAVKTMLTIGVGDLQLWNGEVCKIYTS